MAREKAVGRGGVSREARERKAGEHRLDLRRRAKRIYSELQIPVEEEELWRVVAKHSWENIPEEEKGEGKFYRKGVAGGWKDDLSAEQVWIVEGVTASLLEELYPGGSPPVANP